MITGKAVTLLPFDEKYLSSVHEWINQPDLRELTNTEGPVSSFEHRRWYEQVMSDSKCRMFVIGRGVGLEAVPVGMIALNHIDYRARSAEYSVYVADRSSRRLGVAYEATVLMLRFGFMRLGLNRIFLRVLKSNAPATRLYEKLGFVFEGVAREDSFLNGRMESSAYYSMLSSEFEEKFGRIGATCPSAS